ncbi:MAG: pyridoxal phosphate-dependent aminotransferase [Gammaproteobacteria bacterium]|nr:pyridoxal phosphate-dependent aminotransferase [Gammaproteobacteria bacterium]
MKFAALTEHINRDRIDAWAVHNRAITRLEAGEPVIMLSIGQEGDEQTPADIVAAANNSLQAGRHHYSQVEGDPVLRAAIARYHTNLTGQAVTAENCTVHTGAQNALFSVAMCLLQNGDDVILSEPHYTTYPATLTASGANPIRLPVSADNDFVLDPRAVKNALTPNTRMIVLNSPSNPLGTLHTRDQYEAILDMCLERDIWLVSDDVYLPLVEPADRVSVAALPGADRVCISICSLSKSHRMTGWRVGWVVAPELLAEHIGRLSLCMHYGMPPFVQDAAVKALESDAITTTVRAAMRERRTLVNETLSPTNSVTLFDSGVGMFVVLDVSGTGLTADEFASRLLDAHNVSTLPCDGFGPAGKFLIRVGLCVDGEQLRTACERINTFMRELS